MPRIAPRSSRDAGLEFDAGDARVDRVKPLPGKTMREVAPGGTAPTSCLHRGDRCRSGQGAPAGVRSCR